MRFESGHAEVLAEGFGDTQQFTIAASGKAFKGLIDGLYSRKIEAVMRELATNAFDAHKAAGTIEPKQHATPGDFETADGRKFSESVIRTALDDASIRGAARDLGIAESTLRGWKKKLGL